MMNYLCLELENLSFKIFEFSKFTDCRLPSGVGHCRRRSEVLLNRDFGDGETSAVSLTVHTECVLS